MSFIINRCSAGLQGNNPCRVQLICTDDLATVTAAGYLTQSKIAPISLLPTDIVDMVYDFVDATGTGTYLLCTVTIGAGLITLVPYVSPNVDITTTVAHIAVYIDTLGALGQDAATAINGGNIQAGLSGTAGTLASFPATAAKGSLKLVAVANTGNTITTISNVAMGQASVISIPDPATATADFVIAPAALVSGNMIKASGTAGLIVDAGAAIKGATTATFGGGTTSNAFTATGLTSASIVTAVILTQAGTASIIKAVPTTDTLTITFSADPGAGTTVSWIALSASI